MTSRRSRRKDKKRNDRLREEAWEAFEDGDLNRARELYGDAVARAPGNARYLFELGLVERRAGRATAAERAWRRAIDRAEHHAGALAALAALRAEAGDLEEALRLGERALARPGDHGELADEVAGWRREVPGAFAFGEGVGTRPERGPERSAPAEASEAPRAELPRTARLDWPRLVARLTRDGVVRIPRLFDAGSDDSERAAVLDELAIRARAIASRWNEVMGTGREPDLSGEPETAAAALPDRVVPEVRLCTAAPEEHATVDVRPGRVRRHAVALRPGDGALVCAARRPVRVGGVWGWQPVEAESSQG